MDVPLFAPLIFVIALAIVVNVTVHFYYRHKHRAFMQELKGSDYYLSQNADIEMDFTSRLKLKYNYYLGDVVFTANNIYLLKKSRYVFKQCGPVSAFTNSQYNTSFRNISKSYVYNKLSLINDRLIIDCPKNGNFNIKVKASIELMDDSDIPALIEKYDLNPKA